MGVSFQSRSHIIVVEMADPASSASQCSLLKEKIGTRGMSVGDVLMVAMCTPTCVRHACIGLATLYLYGSSSHNS